MESWLYLLFLVAGVSSDMYLHSPRGSNNRINENTAKRRNANRLFDSQNNDRGGYNVGDKTTGPSRNEFLHFRMSYFQSSITHKVAGSGLGRSYLPIEWTNQHGCGRKGPTEVHCDIILQYMCQPDKSNHPTGHVLHDLYRNGRDTNTQGYRSPSKNEVHNGQAFNRKRGSVNINKGFHESYEYYDDCYIRERNNGLFKADQNLKKNRWGYSSAIHTRQNANGNRRGYECPEERDYYPYWHPSPWKDIAILATNRGTCRFKQQNSFNIRPKHRCFEYYKNKQMKYYSRYNTKETCEKNEGTWTAVYNFLEKAPLLNTENKCKAAKFANNKYRIRYIWAIPHDTKDGRTKECLVALDTPDCRQAPFSRTNHLGNGIRGEPNRYYWILPFFPSGTRQRCVIRARYNISTDDYNPYTTFNVKETPIKNNPNVNMYKGKIPLRLAINTAQFGRTFQDRSHVFMLKPRTTQMGNSRLYNVNVRGKRGNIVQTFPAVEYDFVPNALTVRQNDLVHIQWAGSNSHNNKNEGDAGQGKGGTDRHNFVLMKQPNVNYPLTIEKTNFWKLNPVIWHERYGVSLPSQKPDDAALGFASSGFYHCTVGCRNHMYRKMDVNMNNAPASYSGAVIKMTAKGTHYYMSSRNNAFTNRRQKGRLTVI